MEIILHSVHHIMINLIVTDYVASRGKIRKKNRVRKELLAKNYKKIHAKEFPAVYVPFVFPTALNQTS